MKNIYDYLIIGGGIAGTTAAETIRSHDSRGSIAIISDEPYFLYSRLMLTSFTKGGASEEKLMMRTLRDYEVKRIDMHSGEAIDFVDFDKKEAHLLSGKIFPFKKLLVSSGGRPAPWQYGQSAGDRLFRLQSLDDAKRLKNLIEKYKEIKFKNKETGTNDTRSGRALIVGGSFISLEMVDIFKSVGFDVTLILRKKRLWEETFEGVGFKELYDLWLAKKIEVILEDEVLSVVKTEFGLEITTKKMNKISADIIGVGTGLTRNLEFLQRQLDADLGIKVNKYLEASRDNIWAAGDVAEYPYAPSGKYKLSSSWAEAYMQGSIVGFNMTLHDEQKSDKKIFEEVLVYSLSHLGSQMTFIGYTRATESIETIIRYQKVKGEYIRFFLRDNIIVGAVLINSQPYVGQLNKLIKEKKDLTQYLEQLADPAFDLKTIEETSK